MISPTSLLNRYRQALVVYSFAVLFAVCFGLLWQLSAAKRALAQEQAAHAAYRAEVAQSAINEEAKRRNTETKLQDKADEQTKELNARLAAVASARRAMAADNQRLRGLAKTYATYAGAAGAPASFASAGEAASARAGVLADMLAESDRLAGAYASQADEARLKGLACEAAYDAARAVSGGNTD